MLGKKGGSLRGGGESTWDRENTQSKKRELLEPKNDGTVQKHKKT